MPNLDDLKRGATGAATSSRDWPGVEELLNAVRQGNGGPTHFSTRGQGYGREMSQRPPGGSIRGFTNAPLIEREGYNPMYPGDRTGYGMMSDFAGRGWGRGSTMGHGEIGGKFSGLSMDEDMLLKEQGFLDKGGMRYVLDWDTGKVSQFPTPGGGLDQGFDGPFFGQARIKPTSMAERVGGPGASKPGGDWAGMLDAMEKQQYREKYGEESRGGGGGR